MSFLCSFLKIRAIKHLSKRTNAFYPIDAVINTGNDFMVKGIGNSCETGKFPIRMATK